MKKFLIAILAAMLLASGTCACYAESSEISVSDSEITFVTRKLPGSERRRLFQLILKMGSRVIGRNQKHFEDIRALDLEKSI